MASDALVEHCLELLSPLGAVTARRMFGGHGLRLEGLFFGLIAFDRLYLKSSPETRQTFEAAGCSPFVYESKRQSVTMGYWTVPAEAMESPELMLPWARLALQAALAARGAASAKRATARKRAAPGKSAAKPVKPR